MEFPEPVISQAVEPKTKSDQEKLGVALGKLAQEDPSFRVHTDEESGQTIISGMGELHLEIIIDRLRREFSVDANVGKPQVAYRETLNATVSNRSTSTPSRPVGADSTVTCTCESNRRNGVKDLNLSIRSKAGVVPREYIPAVEKGVVEAMESGIVAGYPVIDRENHAV